MDRCVLCGREVDSGKDYSYEKYLHESGWKKSTCCDECREILRANKAKADRNERVKKVKVKVSDYHLKGFVPSVDGKGFVRKDKMREKKKGRLSRWGL